MCLTKVVEITLFMLFYCILADSGRESKVCVDCTPMFSQEGLGESGGAGLYFVE